MDLFLTKGIVGLYRAIVSILKYFEESLIGLKYEDLLMRFSHISQHDIFMDQENQNLDEGAK